MIRITIGSIVVFSTESIETGPFRSVLKQTTEQLWSDRIVRIDPARLSRSRLVGRRRGSMVGLQRQRYVSAGKCGR